MTNKDPETESAEITYKVVNTEKAYYKQNLGKTLYRYDVLRNGIKIGQVESIEYHNYRTAGRLRYGESYPIRWVCRHPSFLTSHRMPRATRSKATRLLIDHVIGLCEGHSEG